MFSSVGWGEVLVLLIVGLLVIGPERLPGLIREVRAVLLAIRNAVGEARQQLDGEFGEEIKQFSKPIAELNTVRQMGAKGFITKTLLDGDDSFLTSFESTAQDVRSTVDSVRKPNLRDALRGQGDTGRNVPVQQQAAAGESNDASRPVQSTAQDMVGDMVQDPSTGGSSSDSGNNNAGQPNKGMTGMWDDVT